MTDMEDVLREQAKVMKSLTSRPIPDLTLHLPVTFAEAHELLRLLEKIRTGEKPSQGKA